MKCIDNELIQRYLDNEASNDEVAVVAKHMEECPECARKIVLRKHLCQEIITVINELTTEKQSIPNFIHPKVLPERKLLNRKRVLYSVCAACLLFFALMLTRKSHSENESLLRTGATIEEEVDANRPVTEQPMLIQVTDPDGNVTEFNLN